MNLHPKNVQLRRSVDMAKRPPNDSKFFLAVVLILKIANLDAAAGFEDFCPQNYALMFIKQKVSSTIDVFRKAFRTILCLRDDTNMVTVS